MRISTKVKIGVGMAAIGYMVGLYSAPIKAVTGGLYDKGMDVVKPPVQEFYDWATEKPAMVDTNIAETVQNNYKTNAVQTEASVLEANVVDAVKKIE